MKSGSDSKDERSTGGRVGTRWTPGDWLPLAGGAGCQLRISQDDCCRYRAEVDIRARGGE